MTLAKPSTLTTTVPELLTPDNPIVFPLKTNDSPSFKVYCVLSTEAIDKKSIIKAEILNKNSFFILIIEFLAYLSIVKLYGLNQN
jgi:hypothetical protein